MYAYNLSYTPHSTRFLKLLKKNLPGLNDSKLHGVNYVSIREKTVKDADKLLNPCTLYDMMERLLEKLRSKADVFLHNKTYEVSFHQFSLVNRAFFCIF